MAKMAGSSFSSISSEEFVKKLKAQSATTKKTTTPKKKTETKKVVEEVVNDDAGEIEKENDLLTTCNQSSQKNEEKSFDELRDLFGIGFSERDYREMYRKYVSLQKNYPLRTEMHTEALVTYVKYAFKRDQAIANDDMDAAEKWGKLTAKQATDAKINPNQLSAADLSDGISNFSKLVEAVEKAQDIIPILPKYRQAPLDMVDYTIWQYVNYIRRLQNMPDIKYADLYKFLDEKYKENKDSLPFLKQDPNGHYDDTEESL